MICPTLAQAVAGSWERRVCKSQITAGEKRKHGSMEEGRKEGDCKWERYREREEIKSESPGHRALSSSCSSAHTLPLPQLPQRKEQKEEEEEEGEQKEDTEPTVGREED
ncbi:hypothetical protein GN956_G19752 [Arapaima gigas]